MHGGAQGPISFCDQLAFQYTFADADDRVCGLTDMLLNWQNQLLRNRYKRCQCRNN